MLSRIDIQALKVIRELSVELDQFTVLVGPNACGKSSVLRAIEYLCRMRDTAPREIFVDRDALDEIKTRGVDGPFVLGADLTEWRLRWLVEVTQSDDDSGVRIQTSRRESDDWQDVPLDTNVAGWVGSLGEALSEPDGYPFSVPDDHGCTTPLIARVPSAASLDFQFARLAAPAIMPVGAARVAPDGAGLAAVLAYLALEHRACFENIKQAVLEVIPAIRDIRVRNVRVLRPADEFRRDRGLKKDEWRRRHDPFDDTEIEVPGHELVFDTATGAAGLPARAMSDGTLRLLGLLTVVLGPEPPRMLLLDNIEYGLHPRALHDVVGLLREALKQHPELQIVAATHSADLLDYVEPAQIRLLWPGDDGYTRCVRMTEHPSFDEWKALMTPSEMWAEFDREQQPPRAEDE